MLWGSASIVMEFDDQLKLGHLLLNDRECRVCGEKRFNDGFYRTRKGRGAVASSYAYECKVCTIKRIVEQEKESTFYDWQYPDW